MPTLPPDFADRTPQGDTLTRQICNHCGFVAYQNPKIVVGSVVRHNGMILLCRRAIEPRKGFWTIPAGYLELGETPEQGALREAREEACASLELKGLLAVYSVPRLSQVQLIYRASLRDGLHSPGEESLETGLFRLDEIPYGEIAFPTVHWALRHELMVENGEAIAPFSNPPGGANEAHL